MLDHVITAALHRFWDKVSISTADECWLWTGAKAAGYGSFHVGFVSGKRFIEYAHRFSYRIHNGAIPQGMVIRHSCDNRLCVNPQHLLIGTHADNIADKMSRGRSRSPQGVNQSFAKLTDAQVLEIRAHPEVSGVEFAQRFGVTHPTVYQVRNRKTWRHI